jgi:hypothetical protein
LLKNLQSSLRQFRRQPTFAAAVVLTLALASARRLMMAATALTTTMNDLGCRKRDLSSEYKTAR